MKAVLPVSASVGRSEFSSASVAIRRIFCAPETAGAAKGQAGFTLIEVLVSLSILSISLGVLLAVFLQGLDRSRETRDEASARALAESLISQSRAADNPSTGASAGKTNNFSWRLQVVPYGSAQDQAAWQEGVAQIVTTVTWRGTGGMRSISLSTLRLLPKAGGGNSE